MVSPILYLVFLLCNSCALVGSLNDEGSALLLFKQSIKELPEGLLNNWNSADENPCSWHGVTCREEKVVSLCIAKRQLVGSLPPALGNLSALRRINLRNNKFLGSLPIELFSIKWLQSLILSGNSFSGSVPHEIGNLPNLQFLDLSQNSFNGSIPSSLIQCKRLKSLVLSQNNFTGFLPIGFGSSLIALHNLNVSFNRLNGSIPRDMGKFSSLQGTLDLSHNFFTGQIPASLGSLPEKVYIDLSYNNLSGRIPENGSLAEIGPTAFIGNPLLCGLPLKILCPSANVDSNPRPLFPVLPTDGSSSKTGRNRIGILIAIVVATTVGICFAAFLFCYCYRNFHARKNGETVSGSHFEEGKECFCFRKAIPETLSENAEKHDLVTLDLQVNFDFDELLKASAFVLGKSRIGILYKVVIENGPILAVRRLEEGGPQRFKEFQTEVEAIGKIRHPNIVALRAYYWSADEKLLIYDYIPNGDLATAIHGKAGMVSFTPLPWPVRLRIMKGIATGLAYLHEFSPKKYVHGDLKPSNILLGQNMEPHISDFGLGHLANMAGESPYSQTNATFGTPSNSPNEFTALRSTMVVGSYYQAPEALKTMKPSQKWDVYSYGVILLEMISGKSPLIQVGSSGMDLARWIQLCLKERKALSNTLDPFLAHDPDNEEEIVAVLKIGLACAHESPERRPSIRHVLDTLDRLATPTC